MTKPTSSAKYQPRISTAALTKATEGHELTPRQRQRQRRRKELIAAAREVFYETHYVTATVEDIIQRAEISRPTFYRYFTDKDAVLQEILLQDVLAQSVMWRRLAAFGNPSAQQLKNWTNQFITAITKHARTVALFNIATGLHPALIHEFSRIRDHSIELLGQGIPAFHLKGDGSRADAKRRAAAHLLLVQLDQMCLNFTFPECDLDRPSMVAVFVQNFLAFIETYG